MSVMEFSLESVDILRDALKNNNIEIIENIRKQCDLLISVKVREKEADELCLREDPFSTALITKPVKDIVLVDGINQKLVAAR